MIVTTTIDSDKVVIVTTGYDNYRCDKVLIVTTNYHGYDNYRCDKVLQ